MGLYGAVFLPRPLADAIYAGECSLSVADIAGFCFIKVWSVMLFLDSWATKPPSVLMLRSKFPPQRTCAYLATEAGFSVVDARVSRIDVDLPRLDKFVLDYFGRNASRIHHCCRRSRGTQENWSECHGTAAALRRWDHLSGRNTCAES